MNSGLFCQISIHSGHIHISISQHSPPVHCSVFMSFCECLCMLEVHLCVHAFYFLSSLKTILIEMFLEYSLHILNLVTHMSSSDPLFFSLSLMVTSEQKEHLLFSCSGMRLLVVTCQPTFMSVLQGFCTSYTSLPV